MRPPRLRRVAHAALRSTVTQSSATVVPALTVSVTVEQAFPGITAKPPFVTTGLTAAAGMAPADRRFAISVARATSFTLAITAKPNSATLSVSMEELQSATAHGVMVVKVHGGASCVTSGTEMFHRARSWPNFIRSRTHLKRC